MFDINPGELLILSAVAVVVVGPERLPKYAADLARMVREVRSFARSAREQVRSEMGDEFDDDDWEALDPRRYDPRRIVREALLDEDDESPAAEPRPRAPRPLRAEDADEGTDAPVRRDDDSPGTAWDSDAT